MPRDPQAFADVIVLAIKTATAPLVARLEKLEAAPVPVAELAPADLAASLAGLLRQALADPPATKATRKVVRDAQGAVKYAIEETS